MHSASQASRRYAEALLEAATAAGANLDAIKAELDRFAKEVEDVFDLRNVLMNPVFTASERTEVLNRVMDQPSLSEVLRRFLRLVVERDRMAEIGDIAVTFGAIADARAGKVAAQVESATELSPATLAQLKAALEARTKRTIELSVSVNPELLGGIRATVGSMVFDGTIRAELDRLRENLSAV